MNIYISRNGQQLGPFSLEEAKKTLGAGKIEFSDLAWYEGLKEWEPLSSIPGISSPAAQIRRPPPLPPALSKPRPKVASVTPPAGLPPILKWLGMTTFTVLAVAMVVMFCAALIPLLPVAIAGVPIGTLLIFAIVKMLNKSSNK